MFGIFNKSKSYENISAQDFDKRMKMSEVIVLDVRTKSEFSSGHIQGAKNMDISGNDFQQKASGLDKTKTYLVYCRSGMRSAGACQALSRMGFENLYNLSGGIMSWNGKIIR